MQIINIWKGWEGRKKQYWKGEWQCLQIWIYVLNSFFSIMEVRDNTIYFLWDRNAKPNINEPFGVYTMHHLCYWWCRSLLEAQWALWLSCSRGKPMLWQLINLSQIHWCKGSEVSLDWWRVEFTSAFQKLTCGKQTKCLDSRMAYSSFEPSTHWQHVG